MSTLLACTLLGVILGGGAWIVPSALLIGVAVFAYEAYRAHNSGQKTYVQGKGWVESPGKVPYWQIGQAWFAAIFLAGLIAFFIIQVADK